MQLIIRFEICGKIKEKKVTVKNARYHLKRIKRKSLYADLIFIEDNGIEHCIA